MGIEAQDFINKSEFNKWKEAFDATGGRFKSNPEAVKLNAPKTDFIKVHYEFSNNDDYRKFNHCLQRLRLNIVEKKKKSIFKGFWRWEMKKLIYLYDAFMLVGVLALLCGAHLSVDIYHSKEGVWLIVASVFVFLVWRHCRYRVYCFSKSKG